MTIRQAQEMFFINRKARNLSKNTIIWYEYTLRKFISYCEKNGIYDIQGIESYTIESFINSIKGTMRDISLKDTYTVIKLFFTYLYDEEYIERSPMKNVNPPKVEKKIIRTFDRQEIKSILGYYNRNEFIGLRNYLIMCTLFSTGMRKSELLNLRMQDINITLDILKVKGKGNKERYAPIGKTLRRVLVQYIDNRNEYLGDSYCEYLIISQRKQQLTPTGINLIFKKLKKDLGLTGERISCHTFRHSFAKYFILNGGDVFSLQRLLGHSDIVTTKKYLNLNDKEIKLQHSRYNPLDNKDWIY